jgi:predicted ribosome quality control (RQC) complex YloA/Tae2 family protein
LAKKALEECKALEFELARVEQAKNRDELAVFKRKEEKKEEIEKQKKEHPFREFTTEKGCKIYIGKNDEDNEKLTFSYAHGSDVWMHASDVPGSHVVLRVKKEEKPDPESLQDAAQLAIYFSKAKKEMRGNVTITECKFVQRVKGKIGKVTISKHKTVYTVCDPIRLQRLFAKLLPGQALL